MSRLTRRISAGNEEVIVYTKGEYTNTTAGEMRSSDVREVMRKLAKYEDLEEKGVIKKFECALGDIVYRIDRHNEIYECIVVGIKEVFNTTSYLLHASNDDDIRFHSWLDKCQIGHEFYLTKRDAEQELKRCRTRTEENGECRMREIKFKAKTCNGEWVEGMLARKGSQYYISNKAGAPFAYEVESETISQYTGLKDKNGKEIYEGDILKTEHSVNKYCNYLVKFDEKEASYELYGNDDLEYRVTCTRYNQIIFEVIGNKFDNPELLDADKQASKYADNDVMKPAT